jgi:hypothetical protein
MTWVKQPQMGRGLGHAGEQPRPVPQFGANAISFGLGDDQRMVRAFGYNGYPARCRRFVIGQ